MADLFDKLNVLVRSRLPRLPGTEPRRRGTAPLRPGKGAVREVAALRQRVNQALDEEERLTAQIDGLRQQVAEWDQQADQALARGEEATARHIVREIQIERQHIAMLEADLAQHRHVSAELISRVNELEALVAEAQRREQTATEQTNDLSEALSARLGQIRQQLATQKPEAAQPHIPPPPADAAVEDDLARRRARLSGQG